MSPDLAALVEKVARVICCSNGACIADDLAQALAARVAELERERDALAELAERADAEREKAWGERIDADRACDRMRAERDKLERECAVAEDQHDIWRRDSAVAWDKCHAAQLKIAETEHYADQVRSERDAAQALHAGISAETLRGLRDGSLVAVPRASTTARMQKILVKFVVLFSGPESDWSALEYVHAEARAMLAAQDVPSDDR